MDRYLPAWSNPIVQPPTTPGAPQVPNPDPAEGNFLQDAGMRVVALSRWNNYYVAGLAQIQRDYAADGIYLDEIAYVLESAAFASFFWHSGSAPFIIACASDRVVLQV